MGFAAHLDRPRRTGGVPLLIDGHLAAMEPDEAELARQLLLTGQSDRFVAEAFTAEGYPVSAAAVTNWRRSNR